jgi:hypothetical protein
VRQAANNAIIHAVINMDAIAYDGNGDTKARLHTRPIANSLAISDTTFSVLETYGIDIDLILTNPGAGYSDHASFWNEGYGAILIIEEFGADGNPFYHTPNDRIEHFDVGYYEKLAKLSLGTFMAMAVPVGEGLGIDALELPAVRLSIWPNPANDLLQLNVYTPVVGQGRIVILDALGREVLELHNGALPGGDLWLDVSIGSMVPGLYHVLVVSDRGANASTRLNVLR